MVGLYLPGWERCLRVLTLAPAKASRALYNTADDIRDAQDPYNRYLYDSFLPTGDVTDPGTWEAGNFSWTGLGGLAARGLGDYGPTAAAALLTGPVVQLPLPVWRVAVMPTTPSLTV